MFSCNTLLDTRLKTLRLVHRKGKNAEPKARDYPLSPAALAFFKAQVGDRIGNQPLMTCKGKSWYTKGGHAKWVPILKAARRSIHMSEEVTAYVMRHCCIADWLTGGIDPASVGKIAGTGLDYLDKNYHKFIRSRVEDRLAEIETL